MLTGSFWNITLILRKVQTELAYPANYPTKLLFYTCASANAILGLAGVDSKDMVARETWQKSSPHLLSESGLTSHRYFHQETTAGKRVRDTRDIRYHKWF